MNKHLTVIMLVTILMFSFAYAQVGDTLLVHAWPEGTLNTVIHGDTLPTGEQAHKVYLLQQNSELDTTYYITEELRVEDLTLVGKNNPVTGFPPVVSVAIRGDNSSPGNIAVAINNGFVHFKNLYLTGTRSDGSQVTGQCVSTSDSCKLIMENCIFENFGSTGTPNVLNTWNAIGSDIYVTNCLFRNNQSNVPQNPGMNWAGPGVNAIDTMIVKNSTFFVFGGNVEGSGSSMGYIEFDHNTMFMHTKSSPFSMRQMHNAKITNNIFFGVYAAGLDSTMINTPTSWNANFFSPPAILTMDSLYDDLEGDPFYLTEADRNIVATNNAYFWPAKILDNFDVMNADLATYGIVGGKIYAPTWVAARIGAEAILDLENISIAEEDNFSDDPGFDAALVSAASDSMARFVRAVWANGGDGTGSRPFVNFKKTNYGLYADVAADWKDKQNYPVPENLTYTNAAYMTAATDGKPLGDLNWFPDEYNAIRDAGKNAMPTELTLNQNYPNPFNPVTKIEYRISKSDHVTLKVYNLLGQEVASLVNKKQNAGQYEIEFNGSKLASGIYLYTLKAGESSMTKKMVLLK